MQIFIEVDQAVLYEVLLAANYLDMKCASPFVHVKGNVGAQFLLLLMQHAKWLARAGSWAISVIALSGLCAGTAGGALTAAHYPSR